MNLLRFHLQARSAFHFGNRGVGIEETDDHAPSDTIFSALCNIMRLLEGQQALIEFLDKCLERNPPFVVSGGFPYVRAGEQIIRFYPIPGTHRSASHKDLREASWMSESLFNDWLVKGLTWSKMSEAVEAHKIVLLPDQEALVTAEEDSLLRHLPVLFDKSDNRYLLWTTGDVTRVTVDRIGSASNVYQVGRLHIAKGGGLWCMFARTAQSGFGQQRLEGLLAQLGESGLGGERSAGHGQFDLLKPDSIDLPAPTSGHKMITLSHYHPRYDERSLLTGAASYQIVRRQGWVNTPNSSARRHKTVRMITAGSILNKPFGPPPDLYGDLVDIKPNGFAHNVYRCGQALMVGTNQMNNED